MSVQLPSQSLHQNKHLSDRSDSGSSGRSVGDSFWMNSPSPEAEDEKDDEDKSWAFEIVGEEVDVNGHVRYEVDWDGWERADGTTQTWQPMEDNLTAEWRRIQKRRRDTILKDSIDIELGPLSGVDMHNDSTRLRAQAYEEKLTMRRRYSPELEEQMTKLLAEKLGPGADLNDSNSPTSAGPETPPGRGLRLSTVRQQQHKSVSLQLQVSARGADDAIIPKMPCSSVWSNKLAQIASAKHSGSSSRTHNFSWTPVTLPQPLQTIDFAVTHFRESRDSASHKRKVSGKMMQKKPVSAELVAKSNDRADTEYREHRSSKRARVISPQMSVELERRETQEDRVDTAEMGETEHDESTERDRVARKNSRFLDGRLEYLKVSDTKIGVNPEYGERFTIGSVEDEDCRTFQDQSQYAKTEGVAETHNKSTMEPMKPEGRYGQFFDSKLERVEDSEAEMDADVADSRLRARVQMVDEPAMYPVTIKALPNKESENKGVTRSGRVRRLKVKHGEGNPCDRCARYGFVCLTRDRGIACLRCHQIKQKCGPLTQFEPLPRANHTLKLQPDKSPSAKSKTKTTRSPQGPGQKKRAAEKSTLERRRKAEKRERRRARGEQNRMKKGTESEKEVKGTKEDESG